MLRRILAAVFATAIAVSLPSAAFATTPDPAPAETSPPATQAPEEPATSEPDTPATTAPDDGDGIDLLPIALIVGGVIALVLVLGALFGRSKRPTPAPAAPNRTARPPTTPSPQASLVSTAQWIHDQLSLELMGADPAVARQRWATERSRLDNVAIGAQAQFSNGGDPNWKGFGQSVSSLATALDTNLQLRSQQPPSPELINESTEVVNRNRSVLQQWINALQPTIIR